MKISAAERGGNQSQEKETKRGGLDIRVTLNPGRARQQCNKDKDIVQTTEMSAWI